jgi:oligopeptide transport system substrate-binding protein
MLQGRIMLRVAIALGLGLGAGTTLPGCRETTAPQPKTASAASGVLHVQMGSEPASLDPTLAEDGVALFVLDNTLEGLVGYDGAGKLQNWLADSITVSKDGLRYDFAIRPTASWSDGKPVTAADFVVGLKRALTASQGAKLAGMLFRVRGARAYFEASRSGPPSPEIARGLAVRDEGGHLVIELEERTPYFTQVMALPIALPLRQDVLDAHQGHWPDLAPSTGPYRIASHDPDRLIHLEANGRYYGSRPAFAAVDVMIVGDEAAGLNLFEQGRIDILTRVSAGELSRVRKIPGALRTFPFMATYYLSFNARKAPFNDRVWRQAVSGAIRRDELVRALDGGEKPARGFLPEGLEGHIPYEDPARIFAPALKQVSSHREANLKLAPLAAAYDTGARNTLVMEKVQADLLARLGLRLSLGNLDWKSYLKQVQTDPPPIFRLGILSPFQDPIQILESFETSSPFNYLHWSNAEYDRLVREIAGLAPGPKRAAKIREAQAILVDREAIVVPIYHYVQNHAVSSRVDGFRANPSGIIRLNELRPKG